MTDKTIKEEKQDTNDHDCVEACADEQKKLEEFLEVLRREDNTNIPVVQSANGTEPTKESNRARDVYLDYDINTLQAVLARKQKELDEVNATQNRSGSSAACSKRKMQEALDQDDSSSGGVQNLKRTREHSPQQSDPSTLNQNVLQVKPERAEVTEENVLNSSPLRETPQAISEDNNLSDLPIKADPIITTLLEREPAANNEGSVTRVIEENSMDQRLSTSLSHNPNDLPVKQEPVIVHTSVIDIEGLPEGQNPTSTAGHMLVKPEPGNFTFSQQAAAELEIQRMLKAADEDSMDRNLRASLNNEIGSNTVPMHNQAAQPIMSNIPMFAQPSDFHMAFQQQFLAGDMSYMPMMMDYGLHETTIQTADPDELQCLPVVNTSGFSGMPMFKRIKLEKPTEMQSEEEKYDIAEGSASLDPRKKIFDTCLTLLEKLEFPQPTNKFVHIPTVTTIVAPSQSNSVMKRISNVTYDFQSIGPKLKLTDWGLRSICSGNIEIAKQIGINADTYFTKINEKANTLARSFITGIDKTSFEQMDTQMEEEEACLSSFVRHSMTQTEPLVCPECAARKRIKKKHQEVQAASSCYSIGSQTPAAMDSNYSLVVGLNPNQLKALYQFSKIIRGPPRNTPTELFQLREDLLGIYNIAQTWNNGPMPSGSPHSHSSSSLSSQPNALDRISAMNRINYQRPRMDPRLTTEYDPQYPKILSRDPHPQIRCYLPPPTSMVFGNEPYDPRYPLNEGTGVKKRGYGRGH